MPVINKRKRCSDHQRRDHQQHQHLEHMSAPPSALSLIAKASSLLVAAHVEPCRQIAATPVDSITDIPSVSYTKLSKTEPRQLRSNAKRSVASSLDGQVS